jgi:hypothetical protein
LMGVLNAMLTLLESRDGVHILPHTPTYNAPVHGGFRARRILIDRAQSQATIGGTIIVGERTYGLTAGHPFHDTDARRRPPSAVPEFFDYDLDSVLSDSDSDCGSGEDRSTGSDGTLEHTASGRTSSVTLRQWEYAGRSPAAGFSPVLTVGRPAEICWPFLVLGFYSRFVRGSCRLGWRRLGAGPTRPLGLSLCGE